MNKVITFQEIKKSANQIRKDTLSMVFEVQSGHPGGALGCADFFSVLYNKVLHYDPKNFSSTGNNEDVFILSNGHICAAWYSILSQVGYFSNDELKTFRKLGSRLQGHPTPEKGLPGIRIASGSLGQGLSVGLGIAISKKLNKDNGRVFVLLGDGEMQEGQVWEALLFAAQNKIDNLIAVIDLNNKQIDGNVSDVMNINPICNKVEAFNWKTVTIEAGNDLEAIYDGLVQAISLTNNFQPVMVLLHTIMGKGVDFMENDYNWHGKAPNKEQLETAIAQLNEI